MIKSPFKKLFITALHGRERQATDSKKLSQLLRASRVQLQWSLPQAHELAHRRNIIAYLNRVHLLVGATMCLETFAKRSLHAV